MCFSYDGSGAEGGYVAVMVKKMAMEFALMVTLVDAVSTIVWVVMVDVTMSMKFNNCLGVMIVVLDLV